MPQSGREVVIVEAVRTPIGRGHKEKGYYKDTHPNELLGRGHGQAAGDDARARDSHSFPQVSSCLVDGLPESFSTVVTNHWERAIGAFAHPNP